MSAGWREIDGQTVVVCNTCGASVTFATVESWKRHVLAEHPDSSDAHALKVAELRAAT